MTKFELAWIFLRLPFYKIIRTFDLIDTNQSNHQLIQQNLFILTNLSFPYIYNNIASNYFHIVMLMIGSFYDSIILPELHCNPFQI